MDHGSNYRKAVKWMQKRSDNTISRWNGRAVAEYSAPKWLPAHHVYGGVILTFSLIGAVSVATPTLRLIADRYGLEDSIIRKTTHTPIS